MKYAALISLVSFAALPTIYGQKGGYPYGSCGRLVVPDPPPKGIRCGNHLVPTGGYAKRAKIGGPKDRAMSDCFNACVQSPAGCKAVTFAPTYNDHGVCQLYSHGGGSAMRLEPSSTTQFYNSGCFQKLSCFQLKIQDPVSTDIDGDILFYDTTLTNGPERLYWSESVGVSTSFYFAGGRIDGGALWNDEIGFPGYQDPASPDAYIFFPYTDSPQTVATYDAVTCNYNPLAGTFGCTSKEGSTLYACRNDSQGEFPGGIYLTDTPPSDVGGNCDLVTLELFT